MQIEQCFATGTISSIFGVLKLGKPWGKLWSEKSNTAHSSSGKRMGAYLLFLACALHRASLWWGAYCRAQPDKTGSCPASVQRCKVALLIWVLLIPLSGSVSFQISVIVKNSTTSGVKRNRQPEAVCFRCLGGLEGLSSSGLLGKQSFLRALRWRTGH